MQFSKIAAVVCSFVLSTSCRPGRVYYDRPQLDPEVEAEVRRINLERFAGSWLLLGKNGSMYIDISEDGYYLTLEDSGKNLMGGDEGEIVHTVPGSMLLYTFRDECGFARHGEALYLDRQADVVHARDNADPTFAPALVSVEKRVRNSDMPCMPSAKLRL